MSELERLCRAEWGRLLAALIRTLGDFDLAEDALQEAFAAAFTQWGPSPPENAAGWLYATARNKALDRARRGERLAQKLALVAPLESEAAAEALEVTSIPDERLRLIFTCCHPALSADAQVALTLRTLSGLSTEQIARAFLIPATTLAQRLVRAKSKIRDARIPYAIPERSELPERSNAVFAVLYLVFNEGYGAASGELLSQNGLCAEAISLARWVKVLLPLPDADALLALMLLQNARRHARVDADGELVLLADQDRGRWDRAEIEEGLALVQSALQSGPTLSYGLEAAIAAVHAEATTAEGTDWPQIVALYERLAVLHPSPVVLLNRAVAVSFATGPEAAMPLVEALTEALADYYLWHATRADLFRRLGRNELAVRCYERARSMTQNATERRFLTRRIEALGGR